MLREVLRTRAAVRYCVGQICTAFTVLRDADTPAELRGTTISRDEVKIYLGIRPRGKKLVALYSQPMSDISLSQSPVPLRAEDSCLVSKELESCDWFPRWVG